MHFTCNWVYLRWVYPLGPQIQLLLSIPLSLLGCPFYYTFLYLLHIHQILLIHTLLLLLSHKSHNQALQLLHLRYHTLLYLLPYLKYPLHLILVLHHLSHILLFLLLPHRCHHPLPLHSPTALFLFLCHLFLIQPNPHSQSLLLFLSQIHIPWSLDPKQVSSNPKPMLLNLLPLTIPLLSHLHTRLLLNFLNGVFPWMRNMWHCKDKVLGPWFHLHPFKCCWLQVGV